MGDINLIEIAIYFINFIITSALLYLLLYRPVSKFLGARKERIERALQEAEAAQAEAQNVLHEAKAELASTGERARQISHEAIETAALDAENILDNAQEEASAMLARAREQMKAERLSAQERALTELVSLSGELASRILAREVTVDDNRDIADHFFREKAKRFQTEAGAQAGDAAKPACGEQEETPS